MRDNYLRQIFIKCVAAILGSQGVRIDKATFEYIVLLAELRMQETFSDLAQIIKVQRHTQPSIDDIMLWMTRNNIDLVQKQQITGKHVDQLNSLQFDFDVEDISKEQEVFFDPQLFQIKKIVQSNDKVPSYAPEWSPALPPDHTYMATADYPNRVRGLQELHEKLFEEGHMAELALQRLLGSKGSDSAISLRFSKENAEQEAQNRGHVNVVDTVTAVEQEPENVTLAPEPATDSVVEQPVAVESTAESKTTLRIKLETGVAPESEDAPMEEESNAGDVSMQDSAPGVEPEPKEASTNGTHAADGTAAAVSEAVKAEVEPAGSKNGDSTENNADEPSESAPKPYITIVNSEPAPEPAASSEKPISLKINLRKPKKQKNSQRPKLDIMEMARAHALEQQQKEDNAAEGSEETNLQALLEKAMASVDA